MLFLFLFLTLTLPVSLPPSLPFSPLPPQAHWFQLALQRMFMGVELCTRVWEASQGPHLSRVVTLLPQQPASANSSPTMVRTSWAWTCGGLVHTVIICHILYIKRRAKFRKLQLCILSLLTESDAWSLALTDWHLHSWEIHLGILRTKKVKKYKLIRETVVSLFTYLPRTINSASVVCKMTS